MAKRYRLWVETYLDDETSYHILADQLPGDQVTPFMCGAFCANQDVGQMVIREHVNVSIVSQNGNEAVYKAAVSDAHKEHYDSETAETEMIFHTLGYDPDAPKEEG